MEKWVFDIETDHLKANVIRCLCAINTKTEEILQLTEYEKIKEFLLNTKIMLIGHNIFGFDLDVCEKLLGIKITNKYVDTLALSWILFPYREKHSLEEWGKEFGIEKPIIKDYSSEPIENIIHRCTEDIKINLEIWKKQGNILNKLYQNHEEIYRYLEYIQFKLDCVRISKYKGINIDIDLVKESLSELEAIKEVKIKHLKESMPKRGIKSSKFPPKVMFKADGSPSSNRLKWLEFLKTQKLPENHNEEVVYISEYEEPNPNSHGQIKEWLFSIGWVPQTFNYLKEEGKKELRKVPQIKSKNDDGALCPSIVRLMKKEPNLEYLDSLFVISHRINTLKGFLRDQIEGRLYQNIAGLTNTLRLQHTTIVNIPNASKPYAENIRKCFIADEGKIMVGSDLKSIEDSTKRHYIYPLDPEYVKEQMAEGFDPHLDIAKLAGFLNTYQIEQHKLYEKTKGKEGKSYKLERSKGKIVNFSSVYGVGAETLSRNSGISLEEARLLLDVYWKRNWSVKKVAETFKVKEIYGQKWIFNPISKFYYNLRAEKDRFSTINQSSAVYVFDRFLYYLSKKDIYANFQMHDEYTDNIFQEEKENYENSVRDAIKEVNEELKLNVTVDCSLDFGKNYVEVH